MTGKPASPHAPSAAPGYHRSRLLDGPILATLFSIAWPTMLQMLMSACVLLLETWFIGKLGTSALAGASMVFPAMMLMQAMAGGGMGGAVTATIARAVGAGQHEQAQALALHAVLIGLGCGAAFSIAMVVGGPWFYRALGGEGATLEAALVYSNALFLGAPLFWMMIIFSAILRGVGIVKVQAKVTIAASIVLLPLSPLLIFGWGPLPGLGIRGAALAIFCYYAIVSAILFRQLVSGKNQIQLRWHGITLSWQHFAAILRVGGISSLLTVQSNIAALIVTGYAGVFGTAVLAGFGTATRLEHVLRPFVFSFGAATVMMVGTCMGAGDVARARQVAKRAAIVAAAFTGGIGALAAFFPSAWVGLFSQDAAVISAGAAYLQIVGPFYWCIGLGMILYFSSQGVGRMMWPYAGSFLSLGTVVIAGWITLHVMHAGADALYTVVAAALLLSCAVTALGVVRSDWQPLPRKAAAS